MIETMLSLILAITERWGERRTCHGTIACCQYVDTPQCNGWNDPHRWWRLRYRARQRWEIFKDERAESRGAP